MHPRRLLLLLPAVALAAVLTARAQVPDPVLKLEAERIAAVEKVKPAVVAIFANGGKGGGSGVLISKDGYALTNFHVVQAPGPTMQCGLPDGVLYDAVLVGLDKVGDVALVKLLPKKEGQDFPFAPLGNSDLVREGDWSLAMGNPFLLATDFTPTVTFGMVSGVHRYQYPEGKGLLEYADCIQIDTSINPGNSGGPLFNMKGELIGINGRGSFDKRGRVNSGVGYAISINQIKNFLGHLKAGLDADHASLGATVREEKDKGGLGTVIVNQILDECDVARRGLNLDDELVSFDGRLITSPNHFKNVLGTFPRGWRVPLEYRRANVRKEILARLMGARPRELDEPNQPKQPGPGDPKQPGPQPIIAGKAPPSGPAAKYYEPKPGFANYYFNRHERDRLMAAFKKHGDFKALTGPWSIDGTIRLKQLRSESKVLIDLAEEKEGAGTKAVVKMKVDAFPYRLEPLKGQQDTAALKEPLGSGGFLSAMYLYQRLLTMGPAGYDKECIHGGYEPFYPPAEGRMPEKLRELRVDTEVLLTEHGPYLVKWFFSQADQKLLGFEVRLQENEDQCEVYLSDYRAVDGRQLPHLIQVRYGDSHFGTITVRNYNLAAAK